MGINRSIATNENLFKEGDVVYTKEYPKVALIVRRYVHHIYYCKLKEHPEQKEKVYFERELKGA